MNGVKYLNDMGVRVELKDYENIILKGLSNIKEPTRTQLILWAKNNKKNLLYELNEFTKKGMNKGSGGTNKVKGFTNKTNKGHGRGFAELADCENCKASGYWDYSHYTGKLLCFHYAFYECKPGRPVPCEMARNDCPLIKQIGEK